LNRPIANIVAWWQIIDMKNIQIIDGASNATFSLFQATEEEFTSIFPNGREMDVIEDVIQRMGENEADRVIGPIWNRPILKRDAIGIHGTLFYGSEHRREHLPRSGREVDWASGSINSAQRALFAQHRE
jgi:hypothetical protein